MQYVLLDVCILLRVCTFHENDFMAPCQILYM